MLTDLYCTADAKASRLLEVFMLALWLLHEAEVEIKMPSGQIVRSGHENR
jgi:hypothetical protein